MEDGGDCIVGCSGNEPLDVLATFEYFNSKLMSGDKLFKRLSIDDSIHIEDLPDNAFSLLGFKEIYIKSNTLKKIHPSTFLFSGSTLTRLQIDNAPITQVATNESDFFASLRELNVLQSLYLVNTSITTLPSKSLSGMSKLREIYIRNQLRSIEASAFNYLPSLRALVFESTPLEKVADQAFWILCNSNTTFRMSFDPLPIDPFTATSFDIINCVTTIEFTKGSMKYLNRDKFEKFLAKTPLNTVKDVSIDCADTRNQWIKEKYPKVWADLKCK